MKPRGDQGIAKPWGESPSRQWCTPTLCDSAAAPRCWQPPRPAARSHPHVHSVGRRAGAAGCSTVWPRDDASQLTLQQQSHRTIPLSARLFPAPPNQLLGKLVTGDRWVVWNPAQRFLVAFPRRTLGARLKVGHRIQRRAESADPRSSPATRCSCREETASIWSHLTRRRSPAPREARCQVQRLVRKRALVFRCTEPA
jgi:hypothetical protein